FFFFSSRRRHTRFSRDWSSDVCFPILADGPDQLAVGGVAAQLPEERPGQALPVLVVHLVRDGGRGVVTPPLVTALGVGGAADGAGGGALGAEHLVVVDARLVRARGGPGRRTARRGLADPGPAAPVEADAEQQLRRRDA